ncbi:D-amino-acid oxidase [Hypsizygus marmoreus]|uniref:D-amino-acid oxidase n=1 Tax=Hypsizygus marmoreus TaxID=39966 RepID=A0A369K7Q6_HYPMA|nr:D-amino-acid oxidase [Hypsizygus marmoreus]
MALIPGSTTNQSPIIVCGLGIIGLTTSIRLLEAGYQVIAITAQTPDSPLTPYYASSAAGAHHLSFAADNDHIQRSLDRRTFDVMWKEEEEEGDASGLMRVPQHEFYGNTDEKHLQFFETLPDFKVYEEHERPPFAKHAVSFTTLTMEPLIYLEKLMHRFKELGGFLHLGTLTSLSDALNYLSPDTPDPRAIVNCTGLGSLKLKEVLDTNVHPIRGQVVVIRAPWIKEGRTKQIGKIDGGQRTYIIPRRSGEVVIGGTREVDDWEEEPRPQTTVDIKQRAVELYPELVPESKRVAGQQPDPKDLIVVRVAVGLRPARKGGLRLERGDDLIVSERKIPVLHNYGHSGAGWQSSWGCAEKIIGLVKDLEVVKD